MLSSPTELLPLASYCFLMSSTPGPNNLMLATAAANAGYRRTLPQMLGSNLGVGLQTWLTCLGLGSLFLAYPVLHQVLRVLGTLYLFTLIGLVTKLISDLCYVWVDPRVKFD